MLSVFYRRCRFLKIANITSTKAFVVQNQHGFCPNIGCYIDPQGGGGTLIFSYIRRLGPFFGVQNFEFGYFLGFSEK